MIPELDSIIEKIQSLAYHAYCHNRRNCPWRSPEEWERVFGEKAKEYEALYQSELQTFGVEK